VLRNNQEDVSGMLSVSSLRVKMGQTGSPETSVLNHFTPRNIPEDVRLYFLHHAGYQLTTVHACSVPLQFAAHNIDAQTASRVRQASVKFLTLSVA
jgi:hypothetical protein